MNFSTILKEAHKRAVKQIEVLIKYGYKKPYTYRFILAGKMKDIFHELRTGINTILDFEKGLTYNP